ncbi:hypothetical protein D3C83_245760 [compost metagenome]
MQLDPALQDNITVAYYEAGHMMYVREADHRKSREDFLHFLERALAERPRVAAAAAIRSRAPGSDTGRGPDRD